ncbi:MAG: tyrosine-type recombinase/integrase [Clostridiales bacterium]|nr:tyrosine-type recombinase/integrase [Clostridiales bacterium]
MNDDFNQHAQTVMEHITDLGRSDETKRAYELCFDMLGKHLLETEMDFSIEEAFKWLDSISGQLSQVNIGLFKAAINKLNDLYFYGEIRTGHYDRSKTLAGKLCDEFQLVHRELIIYLSGKAEATIKRHSCESAGILLRFQSRGVFSVADVSYGVLLEEFSFSDEKSYYVRSVHHGNLRLLLQFLYEKTLVPYGYTLFVDGMTMRKDYFWNSVAPEHMASLRASLCDEKAMGLDEFRIMQDSLYQEHLQEDYSKTALTGVRRISNLFYLFMDMNDLCYAPAVGSIWLESLKPHISLLEYKHFRRVLCLIEQRFQGLTFPLQSYFVFRETVYNRMPGWCLPDAGNYLALKEKEGWARSTINMYRSSICRFCIGIDALGVTSFKTLTASEVKQFNLNDQHQTPAGKNAYNSRIRKFLQFLGEAGKLGNPFLFLSLPCVCAANESLVITLTEEEQETLRNIFRAENATTSLREKAMLQLGLYMGLRETDVVSLTIDSIDWENVSIRILQEKTDYEIILPMPTSVANALYRYIMYERPASDTRAVFLRKVAPFSAVGRNACQNALNDALPGRDVPGSGFHVTRKTFATNLLKNDMPPQRVAEALGHQGLATVHKYLSLGEERMRLCGFSLSDRNLAFRGGFCHE